LLTRNVPTALHFHLREQRGCSAKGYFALVHYQVNTSENLE